MNLTGKKIVRVRKMTKAEADSEGWNLANQVASVLVLNDGTRIYASSDDEGNNIGTLFGMDKKGSGFYIVPVKKLKKVV